MATTAVTFDADAPRTRAGTPLARLALSRAKKSADIRALLDKRERVRIGLRENAHHTGSWRYVHARTGHHEITLDPNFHRSISASWPRAKSAKSALDYAAAIVRHEVHHGLHTSRDLFALNRECTAHRVPFASLNVAEDIRIDAIARHTYGDYGWYCWHQPDASTKDVTEPLAWLVWDKLCEGDWSRLSPKLTCKFAATVERMRLGAPDGKGKRPVLTVLREFVTDFVGAPNTFALISLLRDLFDTFPAAEQDITKVEGLPSGIVGHGYSGGAAPTAPPPNGVTSADVPVPTPVTDNLPPHLATDVRRFLGAGNQVPFGRRGYVPVESLTDEEWDRVTSRDTPATATRSRAVAARLTALLGAVGGTPTRVASSGARLHVRGAMTGEAQSFRTSGTMNAKRPSVCVVFDQSGSMANDWVSHGAAFMGALLMLHQQGVIDATIVMTGGHRHAIVPPTFPAHRTTRFFCNEGCESVDKTLAAIEPIVRAVDIVLIYTDGALTDGAVNAGQWRSRGVDLIGCAVMRTAYHAERLRVALTAHFHRALIASDGEALATKIVQYIASTTR
jgi:hypothetical protein